MSTAWTEDRTEMLCKLWATGITFSQMAAELGTTRCSIGGKVYRLGLNVRPAEYRRRTPEQIEATRKAKEERRRMRRRLAAPRRIPVNLEALRCVEVEPLGKSLLELGPNDCRYPFGDGPFTFCGHPALEDHSYCGSHFRLTIRRGHQ